MLKVSSLFSQILAEIPRTDFEKLVAKHGTCFVQALFPQLCNRFSPVGGWGFFYA